MAVAVSVTPMVRRARPTPRTLNADDDPRWAQLVARDAGADGQFYYSVETTGVYCRPSCGARRPNPKNVRFHATPQDAERAGYRPCKRCRPEQLKDANRAALAEKVTLACRLLEQRKDSPSLAELAQAVGLSTFHFHRQFKAHTGLTPRQYQASLRGSEVRARLGRGASVSSAIYGAGYGASSRFYEKSYQLLGMQPKNFRAGGKQVSIHFALGACSLGNILVAQSPKGLCAILLGEDPEELLRDLEARFPHADLIGGDRAFDDVVARVVAFVEAPRKGLALPLDIQGTAFQQRVWRALSRVPVGSTLSYRELAERIGAPGASRAVGHACGQNPLAVAIPCHRVVRADGGLSGYRWGLERKRALLAREGGEP
ncbi:MAG: bifunctional DNA-binding transcriptional regulator/O6-methylguanine-DNA methyltransferase Ada [Myxococcales bacterium]